MLDTLSMGIAISMVYAFHTRKERSGMAGSGSLILLFLAQVFLSTIPLGILNCQSFTGWHGVMGALVFFVSINLYIWHVLDSLQYGGIRF